jgi:hypothetical protein
MFLGVLAGNAERKGTRTNGGEAMKKAFCRFCSFELSPSEVFKGTGCCDLCRLLINKELEHDRNMEHWRETQEYLAARGEDDNEMPEMR